MCISCRRWTSTRRVEGVGLITFMWTGEGVKTWFSHECHKWMPPKRSRLLVDYWYLCKSQYELTIWRDWPCENSSLPPCSCPWVNRWSPLRNRSLDCADITQAIACDTAKTGHTSWFDRKQHTYHASTVKHSSFASRSWAGPTVFHGPQNFELSHRIRFSVAKFNGFFIRNNFSHGIWPQSSSVFHYLTFCNKE